MRLRDITDGTSNTLLIVEVREPVPWTTPGADLHFKDMDFSMPGGGPNSFGSFHPGGANAAFADGSVWFLSGELDPQTFRRLIQPADGQAVEGF